MEISFDKTENTQGLIKISVNRADYQQSVDQKVKEYSKTANIKGFRPGKVPPGMIRKMYEKALIADEINKLVSEKLNSYLRESDTQFLGEPISETLHDSYDWENQESFDFMYQIGFAEPFELKIDKKLKAEKYDIKVDDQVINETIENLQRQFGEIENTDVSLERDKLCGSVKSSDGTIDQEINIDLRDVERGIVKKLVGLKIGDTIQIDPKKTFKNEHALAYQLRMNGKDFKKLQGKVNFTLKGISHYKLASVDETLYSKIFGEGSVKTEEEFRARIEETVAKNYEGKSENFFDHQLRNKLIEKSMIKLPDEFLKKWLSRSSENLNEKLPDLEYTTYSNELKWSLICNKIVKEQEFKVGHEDVMNEARELIKKQFAESGADDQMNDQLDTFANNYLQDENGKNYMKVFNQIQNDKVIEYIKSEVTIKEKEISLDEFRKL